MTHEEQESRRGGGFFSGMIFGGLIGAAVALLTAPQSGQATRTMIRDRGLQLRDQLEDTVTQARSKIEETAEDARLRAEALQQKGQEYIEEQKGRVQRTTRAVSRAAKEAWTEEEGLPKPTTT
ncbi:MAG TPA: YtxH domain-containing protein [Anaerolineales bacterium]|nr:YtxH domain-containing protein [Anaerolineales bacterium]